MKKLWLRILITFPARLRNKSQSQVLNSGPRSIRPSPTEMTHLSLLKEGKDEETRAEQEGRKREVFPLTGTGSVFKNRNLYNLFFVSLGKSFVVPTPAP